VREPVGENGTFARLAHPNPRVRRAPRRRLEMTPSETTPRQIRQLARYQVRPEAVERCLAAIREFVAYVQAHEPGTLRYDVWQEQKDPTRFVHAFIFRDAEAHRAHSASAEVKRFAAVLYPECLAPVEFTDYRHVAAKL
jgi:quinol monooxygenase YgiN